MKIRLRIVGLYYNRIIDFDPANPPVTVKDVMDRAVALSMKPVSGKMKFGLTYSTRQDYPLENGEQPELTESVLSITHLFDGTYDFDGNPANSRLSSGSPEGPSLGAKDRPPGIYTLQEFPFPPSGVVAWQYYVLEGGASNNTPGKSKSSTVAPAKFVPFGRVNDRGYTLADEDTIIWRMVAILRGPTG